MGLVQNTPNGVPGEAGARLAEQFGLDLLARVPWTEDILESMEDHQPFNHDPFLPVAHAVVDQVLRPAPLTYARRTPEAIEALQAQDGPAARSHRSARDASAGSAQALGILVGDIKPWRVFREFSDQEWEAISPLVPRLKSKGRRRLDDREMLNGIFWKYTIGGRWEDLPARYGKHKTAQQRVHRWKEEGVWEPIWQLARGLGYAMTESEFLQNEDGDSE